MRKNWCVNALVFVAGLASVPSMAEPDVQQQILEEIRQLSQQVQALDTRIQQLEDKLPAAGEAGELEEAMDWEQDWQEVKPDPEALRAISREVDAELTEAEAFDVIQRLDLLSVGQNSWGSDDPQVLILAKLGRKHPAVLIDAMLMNGLRHYVEYAIPAVDWSDHKELVMRNLTTAPELVKIVIRRGWLSDAAPTLIAELSHQQHLPIEWVRATATVAKPGDQEAFVNYFVQSGSWQMNDVYQVIRRIEGLDLDDAVARAWDQKRFADGDERLSAAAIAVNHGHADALEELVLGLPANDAGNNPHRHFMMRERAPRSALLRATEARGTNAEIRAWYEDNRDHLVFDAQKKRWYSQMPSAH